MITVSQSQLNTVEYLIHQSAQGNHILFDVDLVREAFALASPPMNDSDAYAVEHHIEKLIALEGYAKQRAYVRDLPAETLHRVIKTYLNIVENTVFESSKARH